MGRTDSHSPLTYLPYPQITRAASSSSRCSSLPLGSRVIAIALSPTYATHRLQEQPLAAVDAIAYRLVVVGRTGGHSPLSYLPYPQITRATFSSSICSSLPLGSRGPF